ncbi:MAG: phasin family protein [Pseudomonadota bacterium]
MAVTPKTGRGRPLSKSGSTLSASEALKAAEAAIAPPAKKPPVARKPAAAKAPPLTAKSTSVPAMDGNPAAIVAATTAVDAAPEPALVPEVEAAPAAATPPVQVPDVPTPAAAVADVVAETPMTQIPSLPVIEGTKSMTDMIETGKKFAEETKAKLETVYADMNEKAKAGVEKSTKAIEELSDLTKGNVEAMVESGKIAAKAMETMGQEAVDYSRKSFEKATATMKTFATIKTPTEFFQLQSQMMSSSFDDFAKEAAKSSEAMMKLVGEVAQPLTARVTLVTDKVKSLAA